MNAKPETDAPRIATKCERCNGSGEIGRRSRGMREAPGPVTDDARGWVALTCPDCNGAGEFIRDEDDADDEVTEDEKNAIGEIKKRRYECFIEDHAEKPWAPGRCAGYAGRGVHLM